MADSEPNRVRLETTMSAPLHSPKLTQRRAHPAVVYSTPAGERKRPRVRRGHVEKTRGRIWPLPRRGLKLRDHVPKSGHTLLKAGGLAHSSRSVIVTWPHGRDVSDPQTSTSLDIRIGRTIYLPPAKGGKICLDDVVEMRIRPLIAGQSKGFSNGSGLEPLLRYPCCGSCPSPIMKGNGHPCVSLKHAFRPFLEVG